MKWIFHILFLTIFLPIIIQAQNSEQYVKLGKEALISNDAVEALDCFTKAILADSSNMNAYMQRAFVYASFFNLYEDAINDYNVLINSGAEDAAIYFARGTAYQKSDQASLAIKDFNKAMTLNPTIILKQEILNNRGWAKHAVDDLAGACSDWKQSKKLGNEQAKVFLKDNSNGCR